MSESVRKLFTVKFWNGEDSDVPTVLAIVEGEGAAAWAKDEMGTIEGTRWESDGDAFAYASFINTPDLLARVRSEGYEIDASDFVEEFSS